MIRMKGKTILIAVCVAVLLLATAGTAFSGGWFSSKVSLNANIPDYSASSQPFTVGSIGVASSLSRVNVDDRLFVPNEQVYGLLELVSLGLYPEAEDMFRAMVLYLDLDVTDKTEGFENNEFGYYAYRMSCEFTYENDADNALDAYVRFKPSSNYANMLDPNIFCLQILAYANERGKLVELPRLNIKDQGLAYYYPDKLIPGESITLEYIVFTTVTNSNKISNSADVFEYNLIQVDNNASVVLWNVLIDKSDVSAYDKVFLKDIAYYPFNIDFEWPIEDEEEEIEEELEEEDEEGDELENESEDGELVDAESGIDEEDVLQNDDEEDEDEDESGENADKNTNTNGNVVEDGVVSGNEVTGNEGGEVGGGEVVVSSGDPGGGSGGTFELEGGDDGEDADVDKDSDADGSTSGGANAGSEDNNEGNLGSGSGISGKNSGYKLFI